MEFRSTDMITSKTGFYFGKTGSGYIQMAVEDAAKDGSVLVLAFGPVDALVGVNPVTGNTLPAVRYIEIITLEDFEEVKKWLNEQRSTNTEENEALPDALVFYGLSQYANMVALSVTGGTQPSQPEFGTIARKVNDQIRYMRGFADGYYVTCDIVREEEDGTDRFNVQPAIYKNLAAELNNAVYVAAKADGTRIVQTDTILALNFIQPSSKKA